MRWRLLQHCAGRFSMRAAALRGAARRTVYAFVARMAGTHARAATRSHRLP